MSWLEESNRIKHLKGGILCGACLTILFAAGVGVGMEFKDSQTGGKWDWLDLLATCLGGLIGQILQLLVVFAVLAIFCR